MVDLEKEKQTPDPAPADLQGRWVIQFDIHKTGKQRDLAKKNPE